MAPRREQQLLFACEQKDLPAGGPRFADAERFQAGAVPEVGAREAGTSPSALHHRTHHEHSAADEPDALSGGELEMGGAELAPGGAAARPEGVPGGGGSFGLEAAADLKPPMLAPGPMSVPRLLLVNAVWFASSFVWFLLLIVIVPSQLAALVGEERKGSAVGAVLGCSTPFALLGAPLVGVLSDRVRSRHGRRRPLMVPGALGFGVAVVALVTLPRTVFEYGLLYAGLRLADLLLSAPFNGLIADVTPAELRGAASGIMGAAANLGNFAGAAVGVQYTALGPSAIGLGMAAVLLTATAATCIAAPEADTSRGPPLPPLQLRQLGLDLVAPLRHADFAWVFATRLIFQMGVYTVQEFLEFYYRDGVDLPEGTSPETAVSYGMLCLMTSAVITAAGGGALSDYLNGRRKILVYIAGTTMAISCVCVVMVGRSLGSTLVLLTAFGLGYGCYLAVDFAMVLDVLPDPSDAAKDMAVWSIALTLPQMLATPTGGVLLDTFQRIGKAGGANPDSVLGYQVVFILAAGYLLLSTVLVRNIKGVK